MFPVCTRRRFPCCTGAVCPVRRSRCLLYTSIPAWSFPSRERWVCTIWKRLTTCRLLFPQPTRATGAVSYTHLIFNKTGWSALWPCCCIRRRVAGASMAASSTLLSLIHISRLLIACKGREYEIKTSPAARHQSGKFRRAEGNRGRFRHGSTGRAASL